MNSMKIMIFNMNKKERETRLILRIMLLCSESKYAFLRCKEGGFTFSIIIDTGLDHQYHGAHSR